MIDTNSMVTTTVSHASLSPAHPEQAHHRHPETLEGDMSAQIALSRLDQFPNNDSIKRKQSKFSELMIVIRDTFN